MANSKGSSNIRNMVYSGKHALLPPKSPFPSISPAYTDYVPGGVIGSRAMQKPREGNAHHQRTSSESFLMEEQPSWLDDLLNEPETPVRRGGHRRSSSDSFAYIDVTSASNIDYGSQDDFRYRNLVSVPNWASQEFDYHKDSRHAHFYHEANKVKPKSRGWDSHLNALVHSNTVPSTRENVAMHSSGASGAAPEAGGIQCTANEKVETTEAGPHEPKSSSDKKDASHAKTSSSDSDTKRAKQ